MLMLMIADEEELEVKSQTLLHYLTTELVNHSRQKSILFTRPRYSKKKIYIMPKFFSPVYVKTQTCENINYSCHINSRMYQSLSVGHQTPSLTFRSWYTSHLYGHMLNFFQDFCCIILQGYSQCITSFKQAICDASLSPTVALHIESVAGLPFSLPRSLFQDYSNAEELHWTTLDMTQKDRH